MGLTVKAAPNPKSSIEPTRRYRIPRARYTLLSFEVLKASLLFFNMETPAAMLHTVIHPDQLGREGRGGEGRDALVPNPVVMRTTGRREDR